MKIIFSVLLYLLLTNAIAQTTYPSGVTGCIARWNFTNTGTVTSLPDVSGNGSNGGTFNIVTGPSFRSLTNKGMKFNGSTSYAIVPHSSLLTPSQMTIIALVKMDGFYSGLCEFSQVLSKGYPYYIPGNYGLGFGDNIYDGNCGTYSPSNMQLNCQYRNVLQSLMPGNYVKTGKWYFCASSYDGNTLKYYQVEMDTNIFHNSIAPFFTQGGLGIAIGSNNQDLSIGHHLNPPFPYWFNGSMDEVIIFNKVLTDAEVQSVYHYLWGDLTVATNDTLLCGGGTFNGQLHDS